jgi:hypothetical protein
MKNIYLEPDEEIISVIDRLAQVETEQVNLIVPAGAQIWQNSINLKLLKRQADDLGKEVTLVVSDDLETAMAEKIGFLVKKEKDFPIELVREEEGLQEEEEVLEKSSEVKQDKKDLIGLLVEELKPEKKSAKKKFLHFTGLSFKEPRKKMVDIIDPASGTEAGFFRRRPLKKRPIVKVEPVSEPTEIKTRPKEVFPQPLITASRWPKFFVIFIGFALLVAALVGYLALPTAEIIIFPKTEKVNFDLIVVGSKDISRIDESLNRIPLQEIKIERTKSKSFLATGEKQLNEKARGVITVYNEYSSSPQTLVATTRFESPEGKIFRITKNIVVPGAKVEEGKIVPSSIDVEVVADQPGAEYNIGPTNFTIPGFKGTAKYAGFYGKSQAPMSGGSTEKIKIVSADDIKKAEDSLAKELKDEVKQTLQEQIPTDLKLIEGGLKEEITKISTVEEGTQADRFTIEMKATVRALLFSEEDLRNLVDLNLASQISENKRPLSQTQQIHWDEPVIDWSKEEITLSLHIQEDIAWQIDVQTLKKDLAGLKEIEVRKYLANRMEIERAKVTFWPFWVKRIPSQEKRIKIEVHPSANID